MVAAEGRVGLPVNPKILTWREVRPQNIVPSILLHLKNALPFVTAKRFSVYGMLLPMERFCLWNAFYKSVLAGALQDSTS
jgi:hypothetical protein